MTHLKNPLLMDTNKVQCFCQKVVSQRLEETLHQRHGEAIDARPGGSVLRLPRRSRGLQIQKQTTSSHHCPAHHTPQTLHIIFKPLGPTGDCCPPTQRAPVQPQPARQGTASSPGTLPPKRKQHPPEWLH